MTVEQPARRYDARSFPEIEGIRLAPAGAVATLVNMSSTGALVECECRILPGAGLIVEFLGTFKPASVESRVVRCEVIGFGVDSSVRYRLGLAFSTKIPLPNEAREGTGAPAEAPPVPPPAPAAGPPPAPAAVAPAGVRVPRNRW